MISGFILPPFIIGAYGSEINGLTNSITQYLSIITFLELGIGAVVQSSLYKPLVDHDNTNISKILASANKFFRMIAFCLLVYVVFLIAIFPSITGNSYDWLFTGLLILAISISSFSQYYFGIVNQLLLNADQKAYVNNFTQCIIIILNVIITIIIIIIAMYLTIFTLILKITVKVQELPVLLVLLALRAL